MENLIDKAFKIHDLSNSEICSILSENNFDYLTKVADEAKENQFGNLVKFKGRIQFSNICGQNCLYCENRKDNQQLQRYIFSEDDIVNIAKETSKKGVKNIILQSGESSSVSIQQLSCAIRKLKIFNVNAVPSIGEKNITEFEMLNEAGAEEIIVKLKTSSYTLFEQIHPDMSLMGRIASLRVLKKRDIKIGSGLLIGFPNQTNSSIADDILYLKKISIDSVEIIPFIPKENTPFKDEDKVSFEKLIKIIAVIRLLIPTADVCVSENFNLIQPEGMLKALTVGANVIISDIINNVGKFSNFDITVLKEQILSLGKNLV